MASNAISDEKEPYESLSVQIKFVGVNLAKHASSGKVLHHGGREFRLSRFGTWVFDEKENQEDVKDILKNGGIIAALIWGIMGSYPEINAWVVDIKNYRFAFDVKKINKITILDEIGKGIMGRKIERILKNLTVTDAYKNIKIKLVKILRDEPMVKEKKQEDSHSPFSEEFRIKRLADAERIAIFMRDGNFSWAFMRLKIILQNETDKSIRLQLLIRISICSFHLENAEELESSINQMIKLLKIVTIPEDQFALYEREFAGLVTILQVNDSFIWSIELSLTWIEALKKVTDPKYRIELIGASLCKAMESLGKLYSMEPGAFMNTKLTTPIKRIKNVLEDIKKMNDCDSLSRARWVYYTEFMIADMENKIGKEVGEIFNDRTTAFHRMAGCWSDWMFVMTVLSINPLTKNFVSDVNFIDIIKAISENPELLQEKISDPRIALANDVLKSASEERGTVRDKNISTPRNIEELLRFGTFGGAAESKTKGKEEAKEKKKSQRLTKFDEAQKEKKNGNEAYKKREFEKANKHYDKAISLDPMDPMLHSNKAAVYIEQKNYDHARESCTTAIRLAQVSNRHSDQDLAKIIARLARTDKLAGELSKAMTSYQQSLNLHFDQKVLDQMLECEKMLRFAQFMGQARRPSPFLPFF